MFPRFLELPVELQTQIWEYAIKNRMESVRPIGKAAIANQRFGEDLYYTQEAMRYNYLKHIIIQGKTTPLFVPVFRKIMGVSRHSRLVALEWWKFVLKGCIAEVGCWSAESKDYDLHALDWLIRNLRRKLAGDSSVHKARLSS